MASADYFFLDDVTTLSGTLPGASSLEVTAGRAGPTITATGAATNRVLSQAANSGASGNTLASINTNATTSAQSAWLRRFISDPLAAQTIVIANDLTAAAAVSEGNGASNFVPIYGVYVWRPSTGALIATLGRADGLTPPGPVLAEPGTTLGWQTQINGGGVLSQAVLAGDVIVVEVWRQLGAQSMGTSYANTFAYAGALTGSSSNAASLIDFGTALVFQSSGVTDAGTAAFSVSLAGIAEIIADGAIVETAVVSGQTEALGDAPGGSSTAASDTFTRTIAVGSGWGTADAGGAWSTYNSIATVNPGNFGTNGSAGSMALNVAGAERSALLPVAHSDVDVTVRFQHGATPVGGNVNYRAFARAQGDNQNGYLGNVNVDTSNAVLLGINAVVGGTVGPNLGADTAAGTLTVGSWYWIRFQLVGSTLRVKLWADGTGEPSTWALSVVDTTYASGTGVGVHGRANAGNTNLPSVLWDDFSATVTAVGLPIVVTPSGSSIVAIPDAGVALATIATSAAEKLADATTAPAAVVPGSIERPADTGTAALSASPSAAEQLVDAASTPATAAPSGADARADAAAAAASVTPGDAETVADAGAAGQTGTPAATERLADAAAAAIVATPSGAGTVGTTGASDAGAGLVTVAPSGVEALADAAQVAASGIPAAAETTADTGAAPLADTVTAAETLTDTGAAAAAAAPLDLELLADTGAAALAATPSGSQTVTSPGLSDAATAPIATTPAGTEKLADAGQAPTGATPSAAETLTDAGTAAETVTPTGAGLVAAFDAGAAPVAAAAAGAELVGDAGAVPVTAAPSGAQVGSTSDTGTGAAALTPAGTETLADAGAAPAAAAPAGTPSLVEAVTAALSAALTAAETLASPGTLAYALDALAAGESLAAAGVAMVSKIASGVELFLLSGSGAVEVVVVPTGIEQMFSTVPPGTAVALVTLLPTVSATAAVVPNTYSAIGVAVVPDADVAIVPTAEGIVSRA